MKIQGTSARRKLLQRWSAQPGGGMYPQKAIMKMMGTENTNKFQGSAVDMNTFLLGLVGDSI